MNAQDIAIAIASGDADSGFSTIHNAIETRKKHLTDIRSISLTEGVRVRLIDVRPRYLLGLTGTVGTVKGKSIPVLLDAECTRKAKHYAANGTILAKASVLEII